ncbi:AI-2E family transporter [Microterricola viridarii]|uniref:AI-2E family transporter n=1 Tax=Microterricola viridarii TaxID=412690 RepID=UPI0009EB880E|nr:AI-2E family transporter [Microterricola viridarii]
MTESTGKRKGWRGSPWRAGRAETAQPSAGTELAAPLTPTEEQVAQSLPTGVRLGAAWSWRLLLIGAMIAVIIFLIVQLRLIVIPVLVAVLLAALLSPLVNFLHRHRWPRGLSIAVAMLGVLALVAGLMVLVITQIARSSGNLSARAVESYEQLKQALLDSPLQLTETQINGYLAQIGDAIQQDSQIFISGALSIGSSLGHFVAGMLIALFATLFMLIDGKGIWNWAVRIFPRRARAAVDGAGNAGWTTLGNFVKVQVLVASIDAVGIGLGAAILQVPLAIPIAVLVFLGSFIPIVGAVATGAVAVAIALIYNGWPIALAMLGVVLLVQQIEGHVLQPLIMGTAVKVHPLAVVLVVAAGSMLAGIPGALFAVPVAAVLNVMVHYISSGVWRHTPPPPSPEPSAPLWSTVPQTRPGYRRSVTPTPSAPTQKN